MRGAITGLLVVGMLVAGCSWTPPTPQIVYVTPPPTPAPALPSPEASAARSISFDFAGGGLLAIQGTVPESATNFCTVDRALSGAAFIRDITFETAKGAYTIKVVVIDKDGPGSATPPYLSMSVGFGFDTEKWAGLLDNSQWVEPNTIKLGPAYIHNGGREAGILGTVTCTGYLPAE
jgi:hypothetical protein